MSARPSRSDLNICDEPSSSTLFLPFPSFYVRQLREASHPLLPDDDDDDIGSEPSDDGAERRYSDVSVHSDHLPVNHSLIHCSSVKRSSYTLCSRTKSYPHPRFDPKHSIGLSSSARRTQPFIRPHSLSRRLSPSPKRLSTKALNPPTSPSVSATPVLAYHDPLLVARRSPSTPSYLRFTSNQPQSQTSSCLPAAYQPSRSPRCSTPSNSCSPTTMQRSPRPNPASPFLHPVRSLQADNRYTFCTPPTSNSLPSFDLGRKQPYPTKTRSLAPQHPPVSEPHRSKRASFWKLISGKRLSRREKKPKQPQPQPPMPDQPVRKARPWKYDSFKLKRRSSLRNFSAYPATLANRPPEQTKSLPSSPLYQRKRHRRARASDRASFSAYSVDDVGGRTRGESLSLSHLVQPTRTRLAYYADEKREASSFAGPRARVFVTAEGSSVSSSSDREEDALFCIPDSNSYLSRRQLRAMQYK